MPAWTPAGSLSGMLLGTCVDVKIRVVPAGGAVEQSAGTVDDVMMLVVALSLGDTASLPIRRPANAVKIAQRLAPPLLLASAWMIASRACSIVGLHGVSFMPDTTSCSVIALPRAVRRSQDRKSTRLNSSH